MRVRDKLFISIVSLILLMSGAFFAISHGYMENLFRQYATTAEEGNADQWARLFAYYYSQNGNSWTGVNHYILGVMEQNSGSRVGVSQLTLQDDHGGVVAQVGTAAHSGNDSVDETTVPMNVYGRKVGLLTVSNHTVKGSPVERDVLQSMTKATVVGTVATSVVALLVGAWLVRLMTTPLRSMMKAMRRIKAGDLAARVDISSQDEFGEVSRTFNEMTDRLLRTEEARRHLVADVAHELRTPLTIIQGQLELIQQGVKPSEPATLLPIQDEVARLSRLVQDLHQLSLAEVGQLPLEKVPTAIVQLLDRIVDNFSIEAEEKQIALAFISDVDDLMILLDPSRITQVFSNLLGNALRYTQEGGTVRVLLSQAGKSITVAVTDTGPGIQSEHLTHLFDRFYRADEDRSRLSGGTGLGLAIAKEFVEAHEGHIQVESTVGEGTIFTVFLPIAERLAEGHLA